MRRRPLVLAAFLPLLPASARGQAPRTWGGEVESRPQDESNDSQPPAEPPGPPPATIGIPAPGSTSSAGARLTNVAATVAGGVVRTAGSVGLKYTLEGIEVRGNTTTLARVVLRYIPFHAGDILDVNDPELELTRFRLLGTAFFRDVQLSLRRGTQRGYVVLVVDVSERNTLVVDDLWLGLSADGTPNGAKPLTAYGGARVTQTNLAGTGVALGGAFAVADSQLGLRARLSDPQFARSSWTAEAELLYNAARDFFGNGDVLVGNPQPAQDFAVLQYKRFGARLGLGQDLGVSSQLFFDYRLERISATVPIAASDYRGFDVEPIDFMLLPGASVLSTIEASLSHDTRDGPFLPTRGHHVTAAADASLTPLGSDYPYAKIVAHGTEWFALPWGHVLAFDGFAGGIFGSAPLFERFYVGDLTDLLPDRVLDLNFDRRPAPNYLNTDVVEIRYGNYAAKLDAEYRVPIYRGARSIYGVDLFGSFGVFGLANQQDFVARARGYQGFGRLPLGLTFNAGLRMDTQAGGFTIGIANLIGLIPVGGAAQGAARP